MKRKLIKGLGIVLVAALVATAGTIGLLPGNSDAAEYILLEGNVDDSTSANNEIASWKFAEGVIKDSASFKIYSVDYVWVDDSDHGQGATSATYHFYCEEAYEWPGSGKKWTINADVTLKQLDGSAMTGLDGTISDWDSGFTGLKNVSKQGDTDPYPIKYKYLAFWPSGTKHNSFSLDYEFWLSDGYGGTAASYIEAPFVVGFAWTGSSEVNKIYSSEGKFYSNVSKKIDYKKITGDYTGHSPHDDSFSQIYYYFAGTGYKQEGSKAIVKVGYGSQSGGKSELRMGYQAYEVNFNVESDPIFHIMDVPVNNHPSYPTDKVTTAIGSNTLLYWTADQEVKSADGSTVLYAEGATISDEQLKTLLPTMSEKSMVSGSKNYPNILFTAHLASRYLFNPQAPAGTDSVTTPATQGMKDVGDLATKPTEITEGAIVNGKKFKGWYTGPTGGTKVDFTQSYITAGGQDVTLYGQWEDIDPAATYTLTYDADAKNTIFDEGTDSTVDPTDTTDYTSGQTSNAETTYVKGQTYTGTDGYPHVFQGWFYKETDLSNPGDDPNAAGMTEFIPGTTPITGDTKVIGKWADPAPAPSVTLNFNMHGHGTNPGSQSGTSGFVPTNPGTQSPDGAYTFGGWYTDATYTTPFDFTKPITANTTVHAKWTYNGGDTTPPAPYYPPVTTPTTPSSPSYKLEFETDHGKTPSTQSGFDGTKPGKDPLDTLKPGDISDGYKFDGWYLDKDHKIPYDFTKPVDKDTTLYAKWEKIDDSATPVNPSNPTNPTDSTNLDTPISEDGTPIENPVKVNFESDHGVTPDTQIHETGDVAQNPGAPLDISTLQPGDVIDGWRFDGWYLDPEFTIAYDFNTPLTEDITLYAKWTNISSPTSSSPKTGDASNMWLYLLLAAILGSAACGGIFGFSFLRRK